MEMYKAYFEEDPLDRPPALPTVVIPRLPPGIALAKCSKTRAQPEDEPGGRLSKHVTESLMQLLWHKLRELHLNLAKHPYKSVIKQGTCEHLPQTPFKGVIS